MRIRRFGQMRIKPRLSRRFDIGISPISCERHEHHIIEYWIVANLPRDLIAAHDGQSDINQRNVRVLAGDRIHRRSAVGFVQNKVTLRFEQQVQHFPRVILIFDD